MKLPSAALFVVLGTIATGLATGCAVGDAVDDTDPDTEADSDTDPEAAMARLEALPLPTVAVSEHGLAESRRYTVNAAEVAS